MLTMIAFALFVHFQYCTQTTLSNLHIQNVAKEGKKTT